MVKSKKLSAEEIFGMKKEVVRLKWQIANQTKKIELLQLVPEPLRAASDILQINACREYIELLQSEIDNISLTLAKSGTLNANH